MTKHPEIYYYYEDHTRTVFHSEQLVEDRPDLLLLGSSTNPSKKMAVSAFTKRMNKPWGHKILPLPS